MDTPEKPRGHERDSQFPPAERRTLTAVLLLGSPSITAFGTLAIFLADVELLPWIDLSGRSGQPARTIVYVSAAIAVIGSAIGGWRVAPGPVLFRAAASVAAGIFGLLAHGLAIAFTAAALDELLPRP